MGLEPEKTVASWSDGPAPGGEDNCNSLGGGGPVLANHLRACACSVFEEETVEFVATEAVGGFGQRMADDTRAKVESHRTQDGRAELKETRLAAGAAEQMGRAAAILNEGKKIAILAGQGALEAGEYLEQIAEVLGAPIVKALLGKAAVPDDSPYTTGGIGLLGTRPSQDALEECDTLLIAGSSFPYIEYMPKPGGPRAGHCTRSPHTVPNLDRSFA